MSNQTYIVINDGQFLYPVLRSDLREGDTEARVKAMDSDEYSAWCNFVPADERQYVIGSQEMIEFCRALQADGAETWYVA